MKNTQLITSKILALALLIGAGFFTVPAYAAETTTLGVTGITAVKTFASADNTFENGWKWIFDVTVPANEPVVSMKFADWTSGAETIPAAGNIRFYSAQFSNATDAVHAISVATAGAYSEVANLNTGIDLDVSRAGQQIQVIIEARIPTGSTGGSYSTSYGLRSVADTVAPVITLNGTSPVTVTVGATYSDAGATALDNFDGDITSRIVTVNTVNTEVIGEYRVTYNVKDARENAATEVIRVVQVLAERGALSAKIAEAETLLAAATEGTEPGHYTAGSKKLFADAIKDARDFRDAATAQPAEIDTGLADLTAAISDFEAQKVRPQVDRTVLAAAIARANALLIAAVEGNLPGQYKAGSKKLLIDSVKDAKDIGDTAAAAQGDIDAVLNDLTTAISEFEEGKEGAPTLVSYTVSGTEISPNEDGVNDTITIDVRFSEEVNAKIRILDASGDVVRPLYEKNAVVNPQSKTWDGKDGRGVPVPDGVYTIQVIGTDKGGNTVTNTEKTVTKTGVDKSSLSSTISVAETMLSSAVIGVERGQYPASAKTEFSSSINDAKNVRDAANTTQSDINVALSDLNTAILAFESAEIN